MKRVLDERGFIYIVLDSVFPDYVKMGKTKDMKKRIAMYNTDKPFPTTKLHFISREFVDCKKVEEAIKVTIYDSISPTTLKQEWFEIKHLDYIKGLITEAEDIYE
jgi:hypothetical protein